MSAHSAQTAVMVPVQLQSSPDNYWAWLQHIALAVNQLMGWANQPRLVPLKVATLPQQPLDGMLAYVTDSTVATGAVAGGGTNKVLVWYNGTAWVVI